MYARNRLNLELELNHSDSQLRFARDLRRYCDVPTSFALCIFWYRSLTMHALAANKMGRQNRYLALNGIFQTVASQQPYVQARTIADVAAAATAAAGELI